MNVNQQKNLQKIMLAFDKDYRLSEQLPCDKTLVSLALS